MRARWLKPEFFTDKKVAAMDPVTALVFQALWCMADDGGTALADADLVKAQMFYRWSAVGVPEITGALRHLSESGLIRLYTVGDDQYAIIRSWTKHQQVHKPSKFRHPKPLQAVTPNGAEGSGTGEAPLPAPPPPRHLDTKTPRHLDTLPSGAPAPTNGKKSKESRPKREPTPWMGGVNAAWKPFGTPKPGSATVLQPVVDEIGADEMVARLEHYVATVNPQYASIPDFVSKHALHADRNPKPCVDPVTGLLTEHGMAIMSGRIK